MTSKDGIGTLIINFSKESLDRIKSEYNKIPEGSGSSTKRDF
jgi:hypothetical protein